MHKNLFKWFSYQSGFKRAQPVWTQISAMCIRWKVVWKNTNASSFSTIKTQANTFLLLISIKLLCKHSPTLFILWPCVRRTWYFDTVKRNFFKTSWSAAHSHIQRIICLLEAQQFFIWSSQPNVPLNCLHMKSYLIIFQGAAIDWIKDNIEKMRVWKQSSATAWGSNKDFSWICAQSRILITSIHSLFPNV